MKKENTTPWTDLKDQEYGGCCKVYSQTLTGNNP
jgi:hypothetical protein